MTKCSDIRSNLALSVGEDLDSMVREEVDRHLAACPECREEDSKFQSIILSASRAASGEYRLPAAVRRRIAFQAAERRLRRPWADWLLVPGLTGRLRLLAATSATLAALLLAIPVLERDWRGSGSVSVEVSPQIEMVAEGGVVRLAWTDGRKESYRVVKSANPRDLSHGEVHIVKGNAWVDTSPDSAPIVFYAIE